jgi:NTE family protein
VGVLRALERSGLELVGFAGTSAGAIVAALAAAGYSATEMFGKTGSILDQIDLDKRNNDAADVKWPVSTPQNLLGHGWRGMQRAVSSHRVLIALLALALLLPWPLHFAGAISPLESFILTILLATATAYWGVWMSSGFASVEPVRDAIDQALNLKLVGHRQAIR